MSDYADILDALVAHLAPSPGRDPESPFRVARRGLSGKSLQHFVRTLGQHADAAQSPAALVRYGGGDANEGYAQTCQEDAVIQVACVVAGVGDVDAEETLLEVIEFVRAEVHNRDDIDGLINPLMFAGNVELSPVIDVPLSVAAMVVRFTARMWHSEES